MQETTEPKTRNAGNTDLGPAKPDDPVYSEGWTITCGLFGRHGRLTPQEEKQLGSILGGVRQVAEAEEAVIHEVLEDLGDAPDTKSKAPSVSTPEEKPDNQKQDQQYNESKT
ncbi:MAG TPA: hypothetical protein VKB38_01880 [Terracidiphilus sp.]|nr:hypothetical protein [Terracidiphilus sp.]